MGLKWDIDHMKKGFFLAENGEVLEVKNVFFENGKIDISKIIIGNEIHSVEKLTGYYDYHTSFDDIQFAADEHEQRDKKMETVLEELANIKTIDTSFYSKKKLKNGEEKTYFCERKSSLTGTFFFYHNNTEDHPHFHISLAKNIPVGKNCFKLRKELNKVFVKHEIIPSCEILVEKNNIGEGKNSMVEFRRVKKTLEKISWLYRQAESKVTNPKMSSKKFLESKKFMYKGIEIYTANHCYFSLENKSFEMEKIMTRGKNKGKIEKIKVHSIQETLEKYTEFSEVGGSKQFVQEIIDRVESLENKKLDRNCLEKYKKIDFSDKKEMLKTLAKKLILGEKISQDYKNFWRENINSDVSENRIVAEGIQKLYKFRKNNLFSYEKKEITKAVYEIIEKVETNSERTKKILEKLEDYVCEEKKSEKNVLEKLKSEFTIETAYFKKIDDHQFLVFDGNKIDISSVLLNLTKKKGIDFKTVFQAIKNNQLSEIEFESIENEHLQTISETVLQKILENDEYKEQLLNNFEIENFKDDITAVVNTHEDSLIYSFYESVESGLKAVLACFKAVLNFVLDKLKFDFYEIEKIEEIVDNMISETKSGFDEKTEKSEIF